MKTVKGSLDVSGIKRCYVDIQIKVSCPNCGAELIRNFADDYISHPENGENDSISVYCETCDDGTTPCEFEVPIKIVDTVMTIEIDDSDLKPYTY